MTEWAALLAGAIALLGLPPLAAGVIAARRFAAIRFAEPSATPPITVMKPLCGDEPGLEAALASFCRQDYPAFQLVFGVQDPADPAASVARRLAARFPERDITLVVDPTPHGQNRKVANLINMLPAARHDALVFADSDLHVPPDYLRRVIAALQAPGAGLVTTLYAGVPAVAGWPARLGATHLTHVFLPGALLARAMGRQDCLGTTMALTRQTLQRVGGLPALADHLADDNVLGQLVRGLGLAVTLAGTVPVIAVQDRTPRALWSHELRWARTIRSLAPVAHAASAIQHPIFWAAVCCLLAGGEWWSMALLALAWGGRALAAIGVDQAIRPLLGRPGAGAPIWLLPLRDAVSVAQIAVSYRARAVLWRGHALTADRGPPRPRFRAAG